MSDLVDSTQLAAQLDPEEWRDLAIRYERASADAVVRFGGHVAKYLGDGLMAYFGYPHAHEHDAQQAVRAGLAIVAAVVALNEELAAEHRPVLRVRVGIAAGAVVVGEAGGGETDVFGDVPNVAARIQALADPDSVVITGAVHRLVSGSFVVEDHGIRTLKGIPKPIPLYRVTRASDATGRLQSAGSLRGLTPFVGREEELGMLRTRWERVQEGEGHVVMISGEAGIGKSRLVRRFRELISTPHAWIECSGDPFLQSTPFYAVTETLQRMMSWRGTEADDERIGALERALVAAGLEPRLAVPLVAPLLSLPVPDRYPASSAPPEEQRRRLLATLVQWTFAVAAARPLVVLVEDLHWIDPSTLELHRLLAEQCATTPLLLMYTARPELHAPSPLRGHHVHVILNRLSGRQTREMVARVAGDSLPVEVVDAVATRTDGVPLFVEELTRLVVENTKAAVANAIPATLEDSLMARLDQLGAAKEIVQVGAVMGREFSYPVMRAILRIADAELQGGLATAVDAELLYSRGLPPEAVYVFKHSLVQEAAYQALLKSKRRQLHASIARVLSGPPEVVAHHYAEAGEAEAAAAAWRHAGDTSVARGALREAEDHYARALALLDAASAPGLDQTRLVLHLALGEVMIATRGYAAVEVSAAYARAGELGKRADDPAQVVFTLMGVWVSNLIRSELRAAQAVADQILTAAADTPAALRIWGHLANGITRYHRGDVAGAWTHLEQARALYGEGPFHSPAQDPGVAALGYAARAAWHLGMADTARARIRSALDLARELTKPFDLATAHSFGAGIYLVSGDVTRAEECAAALAAIATEHRMPFYAADALILRGRVIAERDGSGAVAMMREGVRQQIANGQRGGLGYYLALVAEAHVRAGALDDAMATVDEALSAVPEERVDHPRLLHLAGEVHLARATAAPASAAGDLEASERRLREALAVAEAVGSTMCALRVATTLGRVLDRSGRGGEVRDLLASLYDGFSEGFDVPPLREARALLDELRR